MEPCEGRLRALAGTALIRFHERCSTGPFLGVAVGYDDGRVQKVCSPVGRSIRLLLIFLLVVQHMFL
jgi:hypothetical protein